MNKKIKKLQLALVMATVLMLFIVSCAPKPTEKVPAEIPKETPTPTVTPTEEALTTGEAPVDAVAEDISDAGTIDDELSTNELEDVDNILSDIENI